MAILAAVGLLDLLLARLLGVPGELDAAPGWPSGILRRNATRLVLGGALTLGMISALVAPYSLSPMAALSAADTGGDGVEPHVPAGGGARRRRVRSPMV